MSILEVNNPDAPAVVRRLHGRTGQVEGTNGDGACAIHSVFGERHHGLFWKKGVRIFLRNTFGPTAEMFSARLGDAAILSELRNVLWQELLKPYAAKEAGLHDSRFVLRREGGMIWNQMKRSREDLVQQCVDAFRSEHHAYEKFMAVRHRIVTEFAQLCIRPLEHSFLRPLLTHLNMLEEYENTLADTPGPASGTTKFEALFEEGPLANKLRQSIVEHCGVNNFEVLFERVADIVADMELGQETVRIFDFCESLNEAQDANLRNPQEPFPNFFQQAYPMYLDAMSAVEPQYYLSDVELLALCRCSATNVVIFKRDMVDNALSYLRSAIVNVAAPLVITSIQVDPREGSVRSHFEKLTLAPTVLSVGDARATPGSASAAPTTQHGLGQSRGSNARDSQELKS